MSAARSLREHGLRIGELVPGPRGTIADVAGVLVGHVTVVRDEPDPPAGRGVARSGVTAIVPGPALLREPLAARVAVLNGAGEVTGSLQVAEWGELETPVYLTATMSVGRIYDGAVVSASAEFEQGAVGAGTGMTCLGYKGGIGSSSRVAGPGGAVVGVLVQANFGAGTSCAWTACRSGGCSGIPIPARTGRRAAASRWWRPTPRSPPVS